jgi:hypothetical protein
MYDPLQLTHAALILAHCPMAKSCRRTSMLQMVIREIEIFHAFGISLDR